MGSLFLMVLIITFAVVFANSGQLFHVPHMRQDTTQRIKTALASSMQNKHFVIATAVNTGYTSLLDNWVCLLKRWDMLSRYTVVVYALDDRARAYTENKYSGIGLIPLAPLSNVTTTATRWGESSFNRLTTVTCPASICTTNR
jgi:hypothetical protein